MKNITEITDDEMFYLMIYVQRIMRGVKNEKDNYSNLARKNITSCWWNR